LYETISGNSNKAIAITMQIAIRKLFVIQYFSRKSKISLLYNQPFDTSLVLALNDSLNGISTTTASTGVPALFEYFSGR